MNASILAGNLPCRYDDTRADEWVCRGRMTILKKEDERIAVH
jgi:hypothetical protein